MDLATIEPGLLDWAAAVTGVERACVCWENQPRPRDNGRLCLLSWVDTGSTGTDDVRWDYAENTDALQEMTPTVSGPRTAVLQLSVECFDQRSGYTARAALEGARARIQAPSSQTRLKALELGCASVGPVLNADYPVDDHNVSRCTCDVTLNATGRFTDTAGRTSYIATVGITATVTHPDDTDSAATLGGTIP